MTRTTRPVRRQVLAAVAALAAGLGTALLPVGTATATPAAPAARSTVPDRYLNQTIDWQPCFPGKPPRDFPPGSKRLQCGSFLTPKDWDAPAAGVDLHIAVSRLQPTTGPAARSVLTNPGGPGGPGRTVPLVYLATQRTTLTEQRDILGIDVRGTGGSTNVTCSGGSAIGATLDPRDRRPVNTRLILDSAALTARYCQQAGGKDLSRFITTEQTVKDLDLLRALLGRRTVDWIGYSGGTWMGAAYATYFPDRVGRFVLDGNTQFTARWQVTFDLQPLGFERRFRTDFLPWAAKYSERFQLGTTPAEVHRTYEQLRAELSKHPINLFGLIDIGPVLLDQTTVQELYSKYAFSDLADFLGALRELAAGRTTPAEVEAAMPGMRQVLIRARDAARPPVGTDAFPATFLHITCNDTPWYGDRQSLLHRSAVQGRQYPLVGWYQLNQPCVFWDRPAAATLAPRTGKGVPPVLMVQNVRDPATPYEGAIRAKRAFDGARMIVVRNEGDHTIYPGNPCVDAKVEAYLLGQAPARDATCQGVGLPAPTPPGGRAAAPGTGSTPVELARRYADIGLGG